MYDDDFFSARYIRTLIIGVLLSAGVGAVCGHLLHNYVAHKYAVVSK